jgi:hypothetical protein
LLVSSGYASLCVENSSDKKADQGVAPYAPGGYKVFRNVKDYGARGEFSDDVQHSGTS